MIAPKTSAACDLRRDGRRQARGAGTTEAIHGRRSPRKLLGQARAVLGEHRLGMELHAVDRQLACATPWTTPSSLRAVTRSTAASCRIQTERMVARRGERRRQARQTGRCRRARSPRFCRALGAARGSTDAPKASPIAWMSEADAQHRHAAVRAAARSSAITAALLGAAGPRTRRRAHRSCVEQRRLQTRIVVAHDVERRAGRREQVHDVVGEAVEVVDEEHACTARTGASTPARSRTMRVLCRTSSYSASGIAVGDDAGRGLPACAPLRHVHAAQRDARVEDPAETPSGRRCRRKNRARPARARR